MSKMILKTGLRKAEGSPYSSFVCQPPQPLLPTDNDFKGLKSTKIIMNKTSNPIFVIPPGTMFSKRTKVKKNYHWQKICFHGE